MHVLYSDTYEREGNDAWLIDKIQVIREDGELFLRHKKDWQGWAGLIKETNEIDLEKFDTVEDQQKRVQEYMDNVGLIPDMEVPNLSEILGEGEEN